MADTTRLRRGTFRRFRSIFISLVARSVGSFNDPDRFGFRTGSAFRKPLWMGIRPLLTFCFMGYPTPSFGRLFPCHQPLYVNHMLQVKLRKGRRNPFGCQVKKKSSYFFTETLRPGKVHFISRPLHQRRFCLSRA